jgi:FMN-dependent oxidoreductase (nitrilotriacetate monooxygenase family)
MEYWIELAKLLERGRFDAVFLADVLGVYDVYQSSREPALRHAVQVPVNDPMLVVPVMAQVTRRLGFGVTSSVMYEHPYIFARKMSTLDHLTKGRVGWNIVTSYLDSAARNAGLPRQVRHDERYEIAEEYVEVCYKLWEASWEDTAVLRDKAERVYARPDKVHPIQHHGKYFDVPGIHLCEPSPQRTPVLYQAGASKRGREFAARHAECVFISVPTVHAARQYVQDLRDQAARFGRSPDEIRVFSSFTPIVGSTTEEAQRKFMEYWRYASIEGALVLLSGWTGLDFARFAESERLPYLQSDAMQSVIDTFTRTDPDHEWTVEEMAKWVAIGGRSPVVVGTADMIVDAMELWVTEGGVDGFNITYVTSPGTFADFVELVTPELQRRGLLREYDAVETLRSNLFGHGSYLPDHHPARQYRAGYS